jgi:bifunctional UDP-N-acetylglucosamine pyrophosphorylase / glucosamine-1-phosphate N-acetyltransferase
MLIKAIILAAGKGTRMKSDLLKVVHEVAGKPIVQYVIDAVSALNVVDIFTVVGHQAESVKENVTNKKVQYVIQEEQLGTGHAVMQVSPHIKPGDTSTIVVLAGDCPLIKTETLKKLVDSHHESNASATILTTKMEEPAKYGRILRGKMGTVTGIKEAKDCTEKELQIKEINTGVYAFRADELFLYLNQLNTNNTQGEYYLTDIIHILKDKGKVVSGYVLEDSDQAIGINTRLDLAKTNAVLYRENNIHFMEEGVTILDPNTTFIDSTVKIGQDTIIGPFTSIHGKTVIGSGCEIGPNCYVKNGYIKNGEGVPPFTKIIN